MAHRRHLLALGAFILGLHTMAQFPQTATSNTALTSLPTLSSGMKFMDFYLTPSARTIYNLDMSVYRVLNYPAPPAGMQWSNMWYITEALFDTDPSTIEYLMVATPTGITGNFATFVFREDGTQLFVQDPGSLTGTIGAFMSHGAPIFNTDEGTFMMVHTNAVLGPPVNIYQLPGSLPCMDCRGSPQAGLIGTDIELAVEPFSGMVLMPNPAHSELRIRFSDRGMGADRVTVLDAMGRVVLAATTNGAATLDLDIRQLANGRYAILAMNGPTSIGSLPFIVAR